MTYRDVSEQQDQERATAADGGGGAAACELEGVTKRFDEVLAVDDLTLGLGEGEFFTLLGPSGCGKTTTLRMLAGFEEPTAGRILIDGDDVAGLAPHRRPTNTVFQSYALFPHLSVPRQRRLRPPPKEGAEGEVDARVASRARARGARGRERTGGPTSSPVASSSASRWRARW